MPKVPNPQPDQDDPVQNPQPDQDVVHPPPEPDVSQQAPILPPTDSVLRPQDKIQYLDPQTQAPTNVTILSRAGKASGSNKNWYNVEHNDGKQGSVNLDAVTWQKEESVNVCSKLAKSSEELLAKEKELQKLKDFDSYEVVKDNGRDAISTRWVVTQKGTETRARLVARGFEESGDFQRDSPTATKASVRLVIMMAASMQWIITTTDIKSAFLQSRPLDREVLIVPPVEANVPAGNVWKLKKCLYGLNDAARQFYLSVVEVLEDLGCKQSKFDPSLFYKLNKETGELCGFLVTHIDDFLHAGDVHFQKTVIEPFCQRFKAGKHLKKKFKYIGFILDQKHDGISLDQKDYVQKIDISRVCPPVDRKIELLSSAELTTLRSAAGSLNWVVQGTRPDLAYELTKISAKLKNGTLKDLRSLYKVIRHMKDDNCEIVFPDIGDPTKWKLVVYSDAAHANMSDGVSSMGAHIVFLENDGKCAPVIWHGGKIKRVVRSTIAAEALSLQEGLESAMYVRSLIKELWAKELNLPIVAVVDNKSVVESVYSTKLVDDKRLRIDLGAIKESLRLGDVKSIQWCPGNLQLANCMTKKGASSKDLMQVLQSGRLNLKIMN